MRVGAAAAACAAALAACSGGSHPTPGPTGTAAANSVVVGLINTEDAPIGSFPDLRRGALVGERYVNDTLGGVAGRRLQIVTCTTTGTPESSQACANKLLARNPVAVIGGVDIGAASSLPPLQSAHVPYIGGTPAATDPLTSGGSYMLTGGTATEVLGEVAYAVHTLHVTRLAVVYSDVPGLLSQAASLLGIIVRKEGVTDFKLFPVEGGSADVVPVLSAAAQRHPQAVLAVFASQDCTRIIQGVAAVGLKARMMYPSFCGAENVLAAGGSGVEGSIIASGYTPYVDTSDKGVATYLSALHRYGGSAKPSLLSQAGFSDVVVLRSLLSEVRGSITPASLAAVLDATKSHPSFMSHPFTCDKKQITLLPALCNTFIQINVVSHGRLQPTGGWTDTGPVARLA